MQSMKRQPLHLQTLQECWAMISQSGRLFDNERWESNCEFLEQVDLKPGDAIFKPHGVGVGKSEQGEHDEEDLAMLSLARVAESHFLLEPRDLESVAVVLVSVPAVAGHEPVEGCDEPALAAWIRKVESLQVLHEGIGGEYFQGLYLPAIVLNAGGIELVAGSVGDYLFSALGSPFFGADSSSFVVVALDGEDEVGPALPHPVVECLVVRQSLQVEDVLPDRATNHTQGKINGQTADGNSDSCCGLKEFAHADRHDNDGDDEDDGAYEDWPMFGGGDCNWHVFLQSECGVEGVIVIGIETAQLLEEVLPGRCHRRIQCWLGRHVQRIWGQLLWWHVHGIGSDSIWLRRGTERIGNRRVHLRLWLRLGRVVLREHIGKGNHGHGEISLFGAGDLISGEGVVEGSGLWSHGDHFNLRVIDSGDLMFDGLEGEDLLVAFLAGVLWLEGMFLVLDQLAVPQVVLR